MSTKNRQSTHIHLEHRQKARTHVIGDIIPHVIHTGQENELVMLIALVLSNKLSITVFA